MAANVSSPLAAPVGSHPLPIYCVDHKGEKLCNDGPCSVVRDQRRGRAWRVPLVVRLPASPGLSKL